MNSDAICAVVTASPELVYALTHTTTSLTRRSSTEIRRVDGSIHQSKLYGAPEWTWKEQESLAIADKPARRESMPTIAPIRRAYNVVADNTGLSSCV